MVKASHVVVHARAAILGGLSPAKNRCVPPLRYNYVRRLADEFPHLRVAINGGLTLDVDWTRDPSFLASEVDAVRRIDGVMVGSDYAYKPAQIRINWESCAQRPCHCWPAAVSTLPIPSTPIAQKAHCPARQTEHPGYEATNPGAR